MIALTAKCITLVSYFVTLVTAVHFCDKSGLDRRVMQWAALWGIGGAILGGHVYAILYADPHEVPSEPWRYLDVLSGSKGIIGAMLGSAVTGIAYLMFRRVAWLAYADAAVPAIALGCAAIRTSCFIHGDDFGVVSDLPWAVAFPPGTEAYSGHLQRSWIGVDAVSSLPVHPTQLYHAAAALLGFVLLARWRPTFNGERLAAGCIFYGVTRFVIQFYRDDHGLTGSMLDSAQWFCLLFIFLGLAMVIFLSRHRALPGMQMLRRGES